jgi:DNA-binding transcriptional LysR family regulator
VFLGEARQIVALADQAANKTRLAHVGHLGRLDIGIVGSATLSVIPTLLIELQGYVARLAGAQCRDRSW